MTFVLLSVVAVVVGAPIKETVGPVIDPIAGAEVTARDRFLVPSPRSLNGIADMWFADIVGMQTARGDMARFDPLYMSSHGRSWTQLRYAIDDFDITDPGRPGQPILEVPFEAWDTLHYNSLFTRSPGFRWGFAPKSTHTRALVGGGDTLGNDAVIPKGILDREPSYEFGAPRERRSLNFPVELTVDTAYRAQNVGARLGLEYLMHEHTYLTLTPSDTAKRITVVGAGDLVIADYPVSVIAGFISEERGYAGAQFRWPEELTHETSALGGVFHAGSQFFTKDKVLLRLGFGVLARRDRERPNEGAIDPDTNVPPEVRPYTWDIEDEWNYMARPRFPSTLRRVQVSADAEARFGTDAEHLLVGLHARQALIDEKPIIRGGRTGVTYDFNVDGTGDKVGIFQTVFETPTTGNETVGNLRLQADYKKPLGTATLDAVLGYDLGHAGAQGAASVNLHSPAAGVALRQPWGGAEVFGLLRLEPEQITREVSEFLDPELYNGVRSTWIDTNDDGVPEAGEEGAVRARTGGRYHTVPKDLSRPKDAHFAIGVKTGRFGPFQFVASGVGRFLFDRFTVRLKDPAFTAQPFHDPGGDGRGETRVPGGGQNLTTYAQDPSTFGKDTYVLTNAERPDFFWGLDLQLVSVATQRWFLNLGTAAYFSEGSAPMGSFPDRNDPGIIDEASATKNQRIYQRGRYDHDRSFAINLLTGFTPIESLLGSLNIRYRDGQPFTRVVVDDSLSQGPTAIMPVRRGKPRHTFHMEVATRVQYTFALSPYDVTLRGDILNILGSHTEILEDQRTGSTFRDPLEAVPGRAFFLTAILAYGQ